jgi:hypothetical protein
MTTQSNGAQSTGDIAGVTLGCESSTSMPFGDVAGFPVAVLERLRKGSEPFETDSILPFIRAGADILAPLPGIAIESFDPDQGIASTLSNLNMFTLICFREMVDGRKRMRPHYPKQLKSIPDAGHYRVFRQAGNYVAMDRNIDILEYAATIGKYDKILELLSLGALLDRKSPQVKEGLTRALNVVVTGGELGATPHLYNPFLPWGTYKGEDLSLVRRYRSNSTLWLLRAGADLDALRIIWSKAEPFAHTRLLQLLMASTESPSEIESAIEQITTPSAESGTLPFDIDMPDPKSGKTLLHYAVECGAPRIVEILLHAGANVDAQFLGRIGNIDAQHIGRAERSEPDVQITPLMMAEKYGRGEIAAILNAWKAKRAVTKALDSAARHRTAMEPS